jgi:hypothetical protein
VTTMTNTGSWTVDLRFEEDEDRTVATAVLRLPSGRELSAQGRSRRNPHDQPAPRIGEEVAGARALSNLANELLEVAAAEIERNVHGEEA